MDLENRKLLHSQAGQHLKGAENSAKIALIYACIIVGGSLIVNGGRMLLNMQISRFGGLQNLGLKSVLSTIGTMLPILFNLFLLCMGLGFTGTMLRIARDQYASPQSMKIGFSRFWVLLRATILEGVFYCLAVIASYFIAFSVFFITPISKNALKILAPIVTSGADPVSILENPVLMDQLVFSMLPLYIIMGITFLLLAAPVYYRYRLVPYLLIDEPRMGALLALSISRMAMRGNFFKYLKLDLSMWWYYAVSFLSLVICYFPAIATLLGLDLPVDPLIFSIICFAVYMVLTFLITLFLQPHVEVVRAEAYEILRPRKQEPSGGVVLGNIFDLAREQMDSENNNSL